MSGLPHAADPPTGTFSNNHAAWPARATKAVREQYLEADIANYWAYAQQFTLCDNFYTDVASDSTPNHLMLITADSPVINNPSFGSTPSYDIPSLPANLSAAGVTWRNYSGYVFPYIYHCAQEQPKQCHVGAVCNGRRGGKSAVRLLGLSAEPAE